MNLYLIIIIILCIYIIYVKINNVNTNINTNINTNLKKKKKKTKEHFKPNPSNIDWTGDNQISNAPLPELVFDENLVDNVNLAEGEIPMAPYNKFSEVSKLNMDKPNEDLIKQLISQYLKKNKGMKRQNKINTQIKWYIDNRLSTDSVCYNANKDDVKNMYKKRISNLLKKLPDTDTLDNLYNNRNILSEQNITQEDNIAHNPIDNLKPIGKNTSIPYTLIPPPYSNHINIVTNNKRKECSSIFLNNHVETGWSYIPNEIQRYKKSQKKQHNKRSQNTSNKKPLNCQTPVPDMTNGYPIENLKFNYSDKACKQQSI